MESKQLSNNDISGDIFSSKLFADPRYEKMNISFDRLSFDFKNDCWMFFEHILVQKEVSNLNELDIKTQEKIRNIVEFSDHFMQISKKKTQVIIDLYFDKNSLLKDSILLMDENFNFHKLKISEFGSVFRELNFNGSKNNINKPYIPKNVKNYQRNDNSAFELSKVCLNGDVTYGFNLDKLFFNQKTKEIYLFELLLCEETQTVTPHTSHPNRYFSKNKSKFISLFNIAKEMKTNLYLINYAKENTTHENKVKFMRVIDLRENDLKTPLLTDDKNMNFVTLKNGVDKKMLPEEDKKLKIGIKANY